MKKIISAVLAALFLLPCVLLNASAENKYIIVPDSYLSAEAFSHLELKAENIFRSYGFEAYFLLIGESDESGAYEKAQELFSEKGITNGVVFAMEAQSGKAFISADDSFTEGEKDSLLKAYSSVEGGTYSDRIGGYLDKATEFAKKRSAGTGTESERLRPRFMDLADVIENSLESAIYTDIDSFSENKQSDIVYVIFDGSENADAYAEKYYSDYNFGYGEEKTGVILALSSSTGELSLMAKGDSKKYFTDEMINDAVSVLSQKVKAKDYSGVFIEYLEFLGSAMTEKKENETQEATLPDDYFPPLEGNIGENGALMPRVYDGAKILNDSNERDIIGALDKISEETEIDFVVATVTKIPEGFTAKQYAERYYSHFSFGGEEKDGILLLIAFEPECCFLTAFGKAQKLFSESDLKNYTNSFYSYYRSENFDEAVHTFAFEAAQRLMKEKLKMPIIIGAVLLFFAVALTIGIIASRKKRTAEEDEETRDEEKLTV